MVHTFRLTSPSIRGAGHECVQDILPSAGASVADEVLAPGCTPDACASLANATLGVMHTALVGGCTMAMAWRWLAA